MFSENNKISSRQAFRLITYDLLGFGTLMIPTTIAGVAGRDGIFCIGIGVLLAYFYLKLLEKVREKGTGTYTEMIKKSFGSILGNIVLAGYLIYFTLLAGYVTYLFSNLVLSNLLQEENFVLVLVFILLLTLYGMNGGIEGRARVYELLFWFLMIPLFFMMLLAVKEVNEAYLTPVFFSNYEAIWKGSYGVFAYFSFIFMLLFLKGYLSREKNVYQCGKHALFFSGILMAVIYLLLIGIFGQNALAKMEYPVVTMMSRVQMVGGFLKRTDAFMFGIWFFTLYALLNSAVFYGGNVLSDFGKRSKNRKIPILVILVLSGILAYFFYYSEEGRMVYETFFWYVATPFIVLIPVLLYIVQLSSETKKGMTAMLLIFTALTLSGCNTTEIEDREFPLLLSIKTTDNFERDWLNRKVSGSKTLDYNHLKVILIEQDFLENDTSMSELIELLKKDQDVPLNTYVMVTSDMEQILEAEANLETSLGEYLEQLIENASKVKKGAYPTIGMLYQEKDNRLETLFLPYIELVEEQPAVVQYEVWKRGTASGIVDTDTAMLSFFTENQVKEYTLQLEVQNLVRFKNSRNTITLEEEIETSGRIRKTITVDVKCEGEVLSEAAMADVKMQKEHLEEEMEEYFEQTASRALKSQIDLTNSFKRIGGYQREWYEYYQNHPEFFEEEIQIKFRVSVDWKEI